MLEPNPIAPVSIRENLRRASSVRHARVTSHNETIAPEVPTRILIPAIKLNAPVVTAGYSIVEQEGQTVTRWDVPNWAAAGWLQTSARVGEVGNTVLVGHQNIYGRVFRNLEYLKAGDTIQVQAGDQTRSYRVSQIEILLEKDQPVEVRIANARWIARTDDERLTLVTCWPRNKNTHRLIVVAYPDDAPTP